MPIVHHFHDITVTLRTVGHAEQPRASLRRQRDDQVHSSETSFLEPIHLFDIAAQQQRWLSVSQSVVANNVSNANTPGYKAQAAVPFADVLEQTQIQLASTNPAHLGLDAAGVQPVAVKDEDSWETTDSGNSVSLEQEMIKASDVNRGFALNTTIVKAFHGMLMASVRSGS